MDNSTHAVITGTGSYIPKNKIPNSHFLDNRFLTPNGDEYEKSNKEIIQKFAEITGIHERRYASEGVMASDMGAKAAQKALESAGTEPNDLDYIIVAHNFGDLRADNPSVDMVPSLASRVKQKLEITNPGCVAYDLPFGCPGWLQGVIQSHYYLRSGDARKCLVIGSETLSRICDPHDRDSMIYADGAGAAVLEAKQNNTPVGVLSHEARTDAEKEAYFLRMEPSFNSKRDDTLYMKMDGRKLYQYALSNVPGVVRTSLEKANVPFEEVHKVLIHQANAKMDQAILDRLANLYDQKAPEDLMPMTISWLGNTSVATVPTMLDLILRNNMDGHQIKKDDIIVLSSV